MPPPPASLATLASLLAFSIARAAPGPGEVLIFEDTFDSLNLTVWKHELTLSGEGNWEFEMYTNNRSVSTVRNGSLIIAPKFTNETVSDAGLLSADVNLWGGDPATACTDNGFYGCERTGGAGGNIINPILSARVRTAESFAFTYGRVEVVARLPRGDWLWPAIWLMPANAQYGQWPASGEIDLVESRGNARGAPGGGCDSFSSTLHWGPYWPADGYLQTHAEYALPEGDLSEDYHTYGLLWTADRISTYVDNVTVLDVDTSGLNGTFWEKGGFPPTAFNPWDGSGPNAPFDQRFYLIINVAAGGTNGYFPDGLADGKPWENTSPHAANDFWSGRNTWAPTWTSPMLVDSVRVWQAAPGGDYALRPMI
jgi:beta-glucanase (GH16 family)